MLAVVTKLKNKSNTLLKAICWRSFPQQIAFLDKELIKIMRQKADVSGIEWRIISSF